LDVKSVPPKTYQKVTGRELVPTLIFDCRLADRGSKIWIRYVLVPDLTDAVGNVDAVADYVQSLQALGGTAERVEIQPFHHEDAAPAHLPGGSATESRPASTSIIGRSSIHH
jgi:pyruvate formate lyase activating enzyme